MLVAHPALYFIDLDLDGLERSVRRCANTLQPVIRMQQMHFTIRSGGDTPGIVDDDLIESRRLVMTVHGIDSSDDPRFVWHFACLDQPQRARAATHQVPVRIHENRTLSRIVILRTLDQVSRLQVKHFLQRR